MLAHVKVHPKMTILSSFTPLMLFQTCKSIFLLRNKEEDIVKNGSHWCPQYVFFHNMEISGDQPLDKDE